MLTLIWTELVSEFVDQLLNCVLTSVIKQYASSIITVISVMLQNRSDLGGFSASFQGVAKAFSIAYHMVNLLQKMLFVFESALQWIPQRCQSIHQGNVYYVENDRTLKDFVLRLMMSTQSQKKIKIYANPPLLLRKNNLYQLVESNFLYWTYLNLLELMTFATLECASAALLT